MMEEILNVLLINSPNNSSIIIRIAALSNKKSDL